MLNINFVRYKMISQIYRKFKLSQRRINQGKIEGTLWDTLNRCVIEQNQSYELKNEKSSIESPKHV